VFRVFGSAFAGVMLGDSCSVRSPGGDVGAISSLG
jgi:hypothetical protein